MARKAQPVELSTDELRSLKTILRRGTTAARVQTRARVLDLLHRGQHPNAIAAALSLSVPTVFNIKRRYLDESFDAALQEKPRSGKPRRIDGEARAKITALACCEAPAGPPAGRCGFSLIEPSNSASLMASATARSSRF
jgi:putative transposase